MKKRLFIVLAALALAACGGGGGDVNLTGNWSNITADGSARMTLVQTGNTASGSFSIKTATVNYAGTVYGSVTGSALDVDVTPSNPNDCPLQLVMFYDNNKLTGTVTSFNCTNALSVPVTLQR